jgi:3',5'-nucleoside bisphosphate phosphatase
VERNERALFGGHPENLFQGHGDYRLKNIFIGQDDQGAPETLYVAAIDFDRSYCLPPAFDIGVFLAQFRDQLLDHPEILKEIPEDIFLDAYRSAMGDTESDLVAEVELFRARADLSIASFLIQIGSGDNENMWRVLVEAEEALTHFEAFQTGRQ